MADGFGWRLTVEGYSNGSKGQLQLTATVTAIVTATADGYS